MKKKAIIAGIEPESIAEELGWQVNDIILSINGRALRDVIDFRFMCADTDLDVTIQRGAQILEFEIEKDIDEPLGVEFADVLFDGIHCCGANCVFCFVQQLPKGLRKSLYTKDDDYRLSFLDGNFVTLANVRQQEIDRIIEQRLSPLYVSVHCTDDRLRARILGRKVPSIIEQLNTLSRGHITVHAQIVLCPGLNDGAVLDRTLDDLIGLYPWVESVAVVPVGLTQHRDSLFPLTAVDSKKAIEVIARIAKKQQECKKQYGSRIVWAADEFYLLAGKKTPGNAAYEHYPQFENGVGLVRHFLNGVPASKRLLGKAHGCSLDVTALTAGSAFELLSDWASSVTEATGGDVHVRAKPIRNHTFGSSITVAGLMCGKDIIGQIDKSEVGDLVLIPSVAVREGVFLDDVTVGELSDHFGCVVRVVDPLPQMAAQAIVEECKC